VCTACLSYWGELLFLCKYFVNLERREGLLYVITSGDSNKGLSDCDHDHS